MDKIIRNKISKSMVSENGFTVEFENEVLRTISNGEYVGPFSSVEEALNSATFKEIAKNTDYPRLPI